MPVLYAQISEANDAYLRAEKERTGRSIATIINTILNGARRRGWQVPELAEVEQPETGGGE